MCFRYKVSLFDMTDNQFNLQIKEVTVVTEDKVKSKVIKLRWISLLLVTRYNLCQNIILLSSAHPSPAAAQPSPAAAQPSPAQPSPAQLQTSPAQLKSSPVKLEAEIALDSGCCSSSSSFDCHVFAQTLLQPILSLTHKMKVDTLYIQSSGNHFQL